MTSSLLSLTDRQAILQREINSYISRGFRVQSQTETTAQLLKPKRFSLLWAILWFFFFGVGLLLYLLYYLSKKDETIYLEIAESGQVKRNGAGGLAGNGLRLFGLGSTGTVILCGGCLIISVIGALGNNGNGTSPIRTQPAVATTVATDSAPSENPPLSAPFTTATLSVIDSRPSDLIVDTSKLIGKTRSEVEVILGQPVKIESISPDGSDDMPNGGDARTYQVGNYAVEVDFDSQLGATGLQVMEGLAEENWLLADWPTLLTRVGLAINADPDVSNDKNYRWKNVEGYGILIANDKVGGQVWTVRVFLCQYSRLFACTP